MLKITPPSDFKRNIKNSVFERRWTLVQLVCKGELCRWTLVLFTYINVVYVGELWPSLPVKEAYTFWWRQIFSSGYDLPCRLITEIFAAIITVYAQMVVKLAYVTLGIVCCLECYISIHESEIWKVHILHTCEVFVFYNFLSDLHCHISFAVGRLFILGYVSLRYFAASNATYWYLTVNLIYENFLKTMVILQLHIVSAQPLSPVHNIFACIY